jgi:proton glutamate symport protein
MKKLELHWQILIGMALGVLFGLLAARLGWQGFVVDWIKPFGTIFINALKLIAVPLIIASLIKGISDLQDISKLSSMGGRTIVLYMLTTVFAVTLGLIIVNVVKPGRGITEETRAALTASFQEAADRTISVAAAEKEKGPLQPLVDLVPENIFFAASDNGNMLQVIFFVIFFGIGLILVPPSAGKPVKDFFDGLNAVILKLIDLIMLAAPVGVFALLAALIVETPSWDIFLALLKYSLCVIAGLAIMIFVFYPSLVRIFTKRSYLSFLSGISPAQLLGFSTSSSAATLPVTMERVEEHLGVDDEVASFVLPIGATVNMDGTSLYQAVAAVFIAQAFGMELGLDKQLNIVLTATLASIGSAAVPGAGMVMLVIVLGAIGVPEAGLALIFAVDRILDMCRTTVNVTGDATVAMLVAKSVGKLGPPRVEEWDDYYRKHGSQPEDAEPPT